MCGGKRPILRVFLKHPPRRSDPPKCTTEWETAPANPAPFPTPELRPHRRTRHHHDSVVHPRLDRTGEPGTIATGTVDQKSRRQIGTRGGRRRVLWTSPKTSPNTMLQRTQAGKQSKRNCLAREEAHSPPPGSTSGDRVGQQPFACEVRQLDPMSGTYRR